MDSTGAVMLSIIIVSYNVREFLEQALLSLREALKDYSHEIIVVDNASSDGTPAFLKKRFTDVLLIENSENLGFARANNLGIAQSKGAFVCLLNPDTIVQEDTFTALLQFLETHPDVGMAGAKVLNPDGSLQLACRRSFPTPWVALTKIVGLAKLFPQSRHFGRYNLTFLDPDKAAEVEAISGSFMLTRRQVIEQVGGLDEDFFMYGEDLDWCYRIREAGWKIYYVPDTQIIHFKGESSKKSPFQQRRLFYEAMRLFVHKHFKKGRAVVPSWLLVGAIYLSAAASFMATAVKKMLWPLIDFLLLTGSLSIAVYLRFKPEFPWAPFLLVHLIYSFIWLGSLSAHGVYTRHHLSGSKAASGVLVGLFINSAVTFFFNQWAFSRAVVLLAGAINLAALPLWRFSLKWMARKGVSGVSKRFGGFLLRRRSLIVGDKDSSAELIRRLRSNMNSIYSIEGVVAITDDFDAKVAGVPIVGTVDNLPEIIEREHVQEVIFSTDKLPYDKMLNAVAKSLDSHISFKMAPSNLDVVIGKATIDYIDDIPFVDLAYRLHNGFYQQVKRGFDISLALFLMALTAPVYVWLRRIQKRPLKKITVRSDRNRYSYVYVFQSTESRWFDFLPALPAVVRGAISFVGREKWLDVDESEDQVSLSLKPGLTGFEQVNRTLGLTEDDRRRYHLYYLKNYSPLLDLELLFKTMLKRKF